MASSSSPSSGPTPMPPPADADAAFAISADASAMLPKTGRPWRVSGGTLEVYLVWPEGRCLIGLLGAGDVLFGLFPDQEPDLLLLTSDHAGIAPADLNVEDLATAAERWVLGAGHAFAPALAQEVADVDPEAIRPVADGDCLRYRHGLLWAANDTALLFDPCDLGAAAPGTDLRAVGGPFWVRAKGQGTPRLCATQALDPARIPAAIAAFTQTLTALYARQSDHQDAGDISRLNGMNNDSAPPDRARIAVTALGQALGICVDDIAPSPANRSNVASLLRVAGLRARKITLGAGWHRRDQGALLVTHAQDHTPDALIWDGGHYRTDAGSRVDGAMAAVFSHNALVVSAPLPATVNGLWSLARYVVFSGNRRDAVIAGIAAACIALLGVLVPLGTSWLLSDIVPAGHGGLLIAVGIALAASALINASLSTARGIAIHRIDGRGASLLNSAVTDRLLRLPTSFFKSFSAGDLNQRIENIEQMRSLGVGIMLSAGLTAILSVIYLGVLFYYDTRLALIAVALVSLYVIAVVIARVLQMGAIRDAARLDGEIAGLTYETLEGIEKLRSAAAEGRAMERWATIYRQERGAAIRAGRVGVHFGAFADAYQTITLLMLFAGAGVLAAHDAPAGQFIGFLAAFGSFQGAFVGLSEALLQVYSAQPLVERAKPILDAEPEIAAGRANPGPLTGTIEISGLGFSYGEDLPPVLSGLDLRVRAGQHVAIVGGSGSGKSTLLRLLLGFERARRGTILYDGQDISRLDLTLLRSQIGVVLQASSLFAGSILDNIRGAGSAPLEACLLAAEQAGLMPDLDYFAMGIHTPITEGASTLSGGQRQRILIARALASSPKVLFFDEATSALDNATQAVVASTLDAMDITRITIAHRLSTVRKADRICVLDAGRFVEQGTYEQLMDRCGAFADLAKRQLTKE